jgi:hypothetical protein
MRRLCVLLLLCSLCGAVFAQGSIKQVQMFRDRNGDPGAEVSEFRPEDRKKHFRIELGKLELGARRFEVRYVGVETAAGSDWQIAQADFGALVADQVTTHVELPQDWPIGRYRVELLMGGQPVGSHDYIVTPPWAEQIVGAWTLYTDQGGEPGSEVQEFPRTQRKLHFEAQTTGYVKRDAQLIWRLLDPDGDEVLSTDYQLEPDSPVFNILTYQVSLPRDWPVGRYQVQLLSGRRLLGAHDFDIVAR